MHAMAPAEWRAFLEAGTRTAKLAVVRRDGRPHVVPVWFALDGDELVFSTWHGSVKGRALRRDGRLCLCVDEERPPYAYVMVQGTARLSADPADRALWSRRIAARYMSPDQAEAYGARNDVDGELLFRVRLDHVVALAGIAD
jgi:PPOX class probable F420-dependent enzyme